jgi:hypothetical protein
MPPNPLSTKPPCTGGRHGKASKTPSPLEKRWIDTYVFINKEKGEVFIHG